MEADGDRTIVDAERGVGYGLAKHQETIAKRRLGFDFAARLWGDTQVVTLPAKRKSGEEERFLSIGKIDDEVFAVVWTQLGERRRIIAARKASRKERKL